MSQRDVMNQPEEQIVRRKLSDEVFDRLERMITLGELKPGDEMPSERVLMERFGVGRPAIREAMYEISGVEGMIKTYDKPFTPDDQDALGPEDYTFAHFVEGQIIPIK